ncbi:methylenetetrahydrofolate reductase [NAD(P)H] [Nocardioides sp. ChNu-153]|uniref:methylenetetrahydrofolate reductase [NAD(P)H] n=1 Tax=unclassified Nocardioides TaxID=2615069 RepID=UPI002405F80B|nr:MULTISPECIES: methylenetetrahydrofolate reductase [NAD(P)H] [unclassified Nocardioides]MDF9717804.1 methylenetetrahydrofolate reductase [NAD(P)H] [Nocardioides sp. ChNu-99]MDN7120878.1 methylenetetrahydrofolate reductase [NAD(P)H] [Nocardioides sp. ChNu-153]
MTAEQPSVPPAPREERPTIGELVRRGDRSFSFEFFPPKDAAGEETLWAALTELQPYQPTFVSVTYGAGGTTRDRTIEMTGRIARETSLRVMGHLTCVGHTREELVDVLRAYAAAGVHDVLALRGDPAEGPTAPWTSTPGGFEHAVELVELARSLADELGGLGVGVAAFPEKHPGSLAVDDDARVLAAKAAAGADFAVTQLFFRASDYFALVERSSAAGADIPILPGIMPITNLTSVKRMAELSGAEVPPEVLRRFEGAADAAEVRRIGVDVATEMCDELLAGGAPGLHFYTLNRSRATREIFAALRITA